MGPHGSPDAGRRRGRGREGRGACPFSRQGPELPLRRLQDVCPAPRGGGRKLSRLTGDEFGRLFHSFEHTAFRLETRERYDVDHENDSLRKFLAKERDELPWMRDWLTMIRDATAQGRRFHRVRVVSLPLSDYSRFGVWCAQFTNGAGEDIRYLTRDRATAAGLPLHDYWLFDSHRLVRMHFDDSDAFLGVASRRRTG
ncbi:DUF6879 family protein [Streptomyces sp. MS19]|uniref:DUF6879 family protein n=1 Tax=Streptomyces sp. MS19 TaxID=3385972 RepID=UPI0039A21233